MGDRSGERVRLDMDKGTGSQAGIKIGERSGERVRLDLEKGTESRECY
jgi:hypothetical protein